MQEEIWRDIKGYEGMTEASRQTGIKKSCISQCCSGITKSAGGYIWKKIKEKNDESRNFNW